MPKPTVWIVTAVSALALTGVAGVGLAAADPTPSPSSSPSASAGATPTAAPGKAASPRAHAAGHRDLARRALHGEVTLGGKKHRVVDFQRGTVSAVDAGSVTVRSTDGFVATYRVGATTTVRVAKKKAALADVKTGDHVRVTATKDGSTTTATRVVDRRR